MKVTPTLDSKPLFSNAVHTSEMWKMIGEFLYFRRMSEKNVELRKQEMEHENKLRALRIKMGSKY